MYKLGENIQIWGELAKIFSLPLSVYKKMHPALVKSDLNQQILH